MSSFRVGDKVQIKDTVVSSVQSDCVRVEIPSQEGAFNFYFGDDDLELIERPKTPGQIAYEAYVQFYGVDGFHWETLGERARKGYEAIAEAVRNVPNP